MTENLATLKAQLMELDRKIAALKRLQKCAINMRNMPKYGALQKEYTEACKK